MTSPFLSVSSLDTARTGERDFNLFGPPRRVGENSLDVLPLYVGVFREDFLVGVTGGQEPHDSANRQPYTPDARLATEDCRILRDSVQVRHRELSLRNDTQLLRTSQQPHMTAATKAKLQTGDSGGHS